MQLLTLDRAPRVSTLGRPVRCLWFVAAAVVLAAFASAPAAAQSKRQKPLSKTKQQRLEKQRKKKRGEVRSIAVVPDNPVIDLGGRLTLEAIGTFDDGSTDHVKCHWRLLARQGAAKLAVGDGATTAAVIEAGATPGFVVVEALHEFERGTFLRAKATVLCARPLLRVRPRIAVGVSAPLELELPMLPSHRETRESVELVSGPEGARCGFVRMAAGVFGPEGGSRYGIKFPVTTGSVQIGMRVDRPGTYVIRGAVFVGRSKLLTEPIEVEAVQIARLQLATFHGGRASRPGQVKAGPKGYAELGPLIVEAPQAVAPVVLGYGPNGEALGIVDRSNATVGAWIVKEGREAFVPLYLSTGLKFIEEIDIALPRPGEVVDRPANVFIFGVQGRPKALQPLRSELLCIDAWPVAAIPVPVGGGVRLRLAWTGRPDVVQVSGVEGPSAFAASEADAALIRVSPRGVAECHLRALKPGLAKVRSRCTVQDRIGGTATFAVTTDVLVVAPDQVVACDRFGRPAAEAVDARWVIAGQRRLQPGADNIPRVDLSEHLRLEADGDVIALPREGGVLFMVKVKLRKP
ncbi:MAG: hypothetical protein ACYTGX_17215 [Planctomycetota bacterium]|jgi:hypothetical protein